MMLFDTLTGLAVSLAGLCVLVLAAAPLRDALLWALDRLIFTLKRKGGVACFWLRDKAQRKAV